MSAHDPSENGHPRAARTEALRSLPSVDALARALPEIGSETARRAVARSIVDQERASLLAGGSTRSTAALTAEAEDRLSEYLQPVHRRVRNGTGIVLHTGLGRAPLSESAVRAVREATGNCVVEIDLASLERNRREDAVARLLCDLTGAEAALVVNNNAAATFLGLAVLARGREAVVSRGELVEIGGGFRMPDVMREAGCQMVEVGATNKTHIADYELAIGPQTAALVKVHPSNFRIEGFTGAPSLGELVQLGRSAGVPVFEDLGSGLLADPVPAALGSEPKVLESVRAGADLVCFSGDKLLGGPQAGIFLGTVDWIERLRRTPLYRAMRCDKLALAALEATLRDHRDRDPLVEIPILRRIARPEELLRAAANELVERVESQLKGQPGRSCASVVPTDSFVGSGAHPAKPIPSFAIRLEGDQRLARRFRTELEVPIVGRVQDSQVLLDLRTLYEEDREQLASDIARTLHTHFTER